MSFSIRLVLVTYIVYGSIMAINQAIMRLVGNVRYGESKMLVWLFPAEAIISAMLVFVTRRYFSWEFVGLGKTRGVKQWTDWLGTAIPVVLGVILLASWVTALTPQGFAKMDIAIVGVGTLTIALVGFSEELMWRGLVLFQFTNIETVDRALSRLFEKLIARGLARYDSSKIISNALGIALNAILFSLFHAVNAIGGYAPPDVIYQMIGTVALGVVFGTLALRLPSIRPLMAIHFLWDYFIIMGNYFGTLK
jgi:membrane protease YdiL (CAAX protease family)